MELIKSRKSMIWLCCLITFTLGGFIGRITESEKITAEMVDQAQELLALNFTKSERDTMLSELESQRKNYLNLRKFDLPNSVSPALSFDPRPPGYVFPDKQNSFHVRSNPVSELSWQKIPFLSIPELADLIRTKKVTSLQLTRFFIERIKKYNPKLEFAITITEKRALERAEMADKEIAEGKYRGLLHGIPYGAKDLLSLKGYPTTWGSVPYRNQVIDTDASVIQKLDSAGAILIVKTTLGELAMGDVWFGGKTRNPWNIGRGSSGSSAGSAAAVAAGCLPFAIGSETLGSIVSPSTECGVTGLRSTFSRVSKDGAMALSWSMDKLGPIARTVEDCAIVFNAIKGSDGKDMSVIDAPFSYRTPSSGRLDGVKIGYIGIEFQRRYPNAANDSISLRLLADMGAELIPMEIPDYPYGDMLIVLSAESGAAFRDLSLDDRDDLMVAQSKSSWPNSFRAANFIPAIEYLQANRVRTRLIKDFDKIMKKIDLFVAPSTGRNLYATNLTGHPAIVLPNGLRNGLPTSFTFTGQLFGEGQLLMVAETYQRKAGFRHQHPKLNF